jgi:hypothetical protein
MAKLDDLLSHVADTGLRQRLQEAIDELKARSQFGIVFERHIPETVLHRHNSTCAISFDYEA